MTERRAERLRQVVVNPGLSISECIVKLDRSGLGVLVICDEHAMLRGVITDGDIRRGIMRNIPLNEPCLRIAATNPLTAKDGISPLEALHLMDHGKPFFVNQLPILDNEGRMVDLMLRDDIQSINGPGVRAVVMAGGFGTRLRPLTEDTPKPMLPMGDRPMMEHIIGQLREVGISHVKVTTHYLPEKIRSHFGSGADFGVAIDYVEEDSPLGTAGSLSLVEPCDEPLLVINGDILTKVDFRSLASFHREHRADMTVGVRRYELKIPYGVLDCDDILVTAIREKPTIRLFVNAGIYLLEPHVHARIPKDKRYDMTDLIGSLVAEGKRVVSFPIIEYWMDIGQISDYEKAQTDLQSGEMNR